MLMLLVLFLILELMFILMLMWKNQICPGGRPVARPVALCGSGCWVGRDRRSLLLCSCSVVLVVSSALVVLCYWQGVGMGALLSACPTSKAQFPILLCYYCTSTNRYSSNQDGTAYRSQMWHFSYTSLSIDL